MSLDTFEKQPADKQDFDIDYADYLTSLADTAVSVVSVTVDNPGLTLSAFSLIGTTVKVWTTGGVDGTSYKITSLVRTAAGREKEYDIIVKVKAL
jgi:hypothetical protein